MSTTTLPRQIDASRCLRLRRGGRAPSRFEVARELNVTRTTGGNAVKLLLDERLVWEPASLVETARVGRPSIGLSLNPSGAFFVGLSIETTALTAVLVDLAMTTLASVVELLGPDERGVDAVLVKLAAMAERVMRDAGRGRDRIRGIGVSIPGLVDRRGFTRSAPLLGWRDVDLRGRLGARLGEGVEVRVCNDAMALARAVCATCGQGRRDTFQLLAGHRFFLPFVEPGRPVIEALADLAEGGAAALGFEAALDLWAERPTAGYLNAICPSTPNGSRWAARGRACWPARTSRPW